MEKSSSSLREVAQIHGVKSLATCLKRGSRHVEAGKVVFENVNDLPLLVQRRKRDG